MKQSSLLRIGAATTLPLLLLFVQFSTFNYSSSVFAQSQTVMINEWSQGSSGRKEWVELLVIGEGVNLVGWDLGDESAGDLTFSAADLWQNVPPGTLIVIYNGADRDDTLPADDLDVSDWVLVADSRDETLFEGNWPSFSNSNSSDFPQIRRASGQTVHSLSFVLDNAEKAPAGGEALHFTGSNLDAVDVASNWVKLNAPDASPAAGNGNENRAWIESLQADLPTVPTSEPNVVLAKVYPDGLANNDMDEAILLKNLGSEEINLAGWGVSDDPTNPTKMIMPAGTIIQANGEIWITRNGDAFQRQFGFPADYESGNSNLGANQQMLGNWPGFSNAGDEVVLANSSGEIVDALVYEAGDVAVLAQMGEWVGDSLPFSTVGAAEGQLLFRKLDPATGELLADTNGRSDWGQDPDDPVLGRQVQYPGWNVDRFFVPVEVQTSAALTIAVAPDNAFEAVANLIDKAQQSIQIESHTFESHDLLNHLKQAVQRGVQVDILLEGGPPGGLQDPQRWNCYDLEQAGGNCYIMQNDASNEVFDRYKFMHAKFMIVDGRYSAVSSDNLSPNSWPADDKIDGTFGRRGIVLITDEQSVANHLQSIFAADLDQANYSDIVRWQPSQTTTGFGIETYQIPEPQNATTYTVGFPELFEVREEMTFEIIQAPENYLNPTAGLFALLDAAGEGDTLLVEQQYERLYWGETDAPNLRLTHYISAARRGAEVKILLDSFFDDESHPASNKSTCDWVNQLANQERLELTCRTGNPTGLGIHNKMVLANISGKGYIHVGSINGSEQSAKANREVALQVASDEAYAFLESVFNRDFPSQIFIPIVTHEQNGAILRPLISEVLYNPFGSADDAEFIEIVNPSNRPIDISGYSLSDAITAEDYADLRRFPQGTVLPPKEVLVVAQQSKALEDQFFVKADFEILDSDPDVPELIDDLTWGDPSTFIRLSNVGDVIFLRDSANIPVDVLAYGEVQVDGYPICPAVTLAGASIRRIVVEVDSGSCSDFEEWGSPTPGQAP